MYGDDLMKTKSTLIFLNCCTFARPVIATAQTFRCAAFFCSDVGSPRSSQCFTVSSKSSSMYPINDIYATARVIFYHSQQEHTICWLFDNFLYNVFTFFCT